MHILTENQPFSFGETVYPSGGHYGPLKNHYLALVNVYKGIMYALIDNVQYEVTAGQTALFYNEVSSDYFFEKSCEDYFSWCETGEPLLTTELINEFSNLPSVIPTSDRMHTLMNIGVKFEDVKNKNREILINKLGQTILYLFIDEAKNNRDTNELPELVRKTKQYIESNFCEISKMDIISDKMEVTPNYLGKKYKEYTGITPTQYI